MAAAQEPPLHILHLEGKPDDAELIRQTLARARIACRIKVVSTKAAFVSALERGGIDLILSEFSVPGFDGLSALRTARATRPDTPFILVSGTVGEEAAIECAQLGVNEHVLKNRLQRLAPAVHRALSEADGRRKRPQDREQFRHSQEVEAIGRLAGGVADDFNNLLSVIMGFSELALAEVAPDSPLRDKIEQVMSAAQRASSLTRQLLAFSPHQTVEPKILDLNVRISEMDTTLRRLLGGDIELNTVAGEDLAAVSADLGQIEQILMNLTVNARDAMPHGGRLVIETANVVLNAADPEKPPELSPGPYVMMSFQDSGIVTNVETQAPLFEPFFTTKEAGKGVGLRLVTVYGIVKQGGGGICVTREPGAGSCFRIYLPRVGQDRREPTPVEPTIERGSETILLVEDQDPVRDVLRQSLEEFGYTVLEANTPSRAVEICRQKGVIDLLMTDVNLPKMSGHDLVQAVTPLRPDLKVLYMSGYAEDTRLRAEVLKGAAAFLQKPFAITVMARKVREVLDAAVRPSGEQGDPPIGDESDAQNEYASVLDSRAKAPHRSIVES